MRELENVLERAAIISGNQIIQPEHLPTEMLNSNGEFAATNPATHGLSMTESAQTASSNTLSLPSAVEALERELIAKALATTNGNKSKAAKVLEISERSLWYKLSQYGIG